MTQLNSHYSNEHLDNLKIFTQSELTDLQKYQFKHFCKQFKQAMPQANEVAPLLFEGSNLVGFLRLIPFSNNDKDADNTSYLLRGLFIAPKYRNQGFARRLVQSAPCFLNIASTITLFSLVHLEKFYHSESYRPVETEALHHEIQKRWLKAQEEGKNWVLMQKVVD